MPMHQTRERLIRVGTVLAKRMFRNRLEPAASEVSLVVATRIHANQSRDESDQMRWKGFQGSRRIELRKQTNQRFILLLDHRRYVHFRIERLGSNAVAIGQMPQV